MDMTKRASVPEETADTPGMSDQRTASKEETSKREVVSIGCGSSDSRTSIPSIRNEKRFDGFAYKSCRRHETSYKLSGHFQLN